VCTHSLSSSINHLLEDIFASLRKIQKERSTNKKVRQPSFSGSLASEATAAAYSRCRSCSHFHRSNTFYSSLSLSLSLSLLPLQTIPAELVFNFRMLESDRDKLATSAIYMDANTLTGRYNPSLLPVKPTGGDKVVREMAVFRPHTAMPIPFLEYFNILYITPEWLNLTKLKGIDAKNILVRIRLKDNDKDLEARGLRVFYGKSSCPVFHDEALASGTLPIWLWHARARESATECVLRAWRISQ